jgi:hypothetical protein
MFSNAIWFVSLQTFMSFFGIFSIWTLGLFAFFCSNLETPFIFHSGSIINFANLRSAVAGKATRWSIYSQYFPSRSQLDDIYFTCCYLQKINFNLNSKYSTGAILKGKFYGT